jgi:predicted nucleic acid-binding protein
MTSSILLLTEVPRGLRGNVHRTEPWRDVGPLLKSADRLLRTMVLRPIDPYVLQEAAAVTDPLLRSLDAIHVATAVRLRRLLDAFVTYDKRQAAVALEMGLRVASPGA